MSRLSRFAAAVLALVFAAFSCAAAAPGDVLSPDWVTCLEESAQVEQLVVITVLGGSRAQLSMHESDENGLWHVLLSAPAFIGENGIDKEAEGDGKTPRGAFRPGCAFGIEADPGCTMPYHELTEFDYWSGDINCRYNRMADVRSCPELDTSVCEHLADFSPYYNYCLDIGYNTEGVPGMGCAIFLHCADPGRPYTAGCIAIPESDMITVIRCVREDCLIVIDDLERFIGTN